MPKQKHMEIVVNNLIKNLEKRHMEGRYFKTKEELISYLDDEIKSDEKITSGGSVTLKELGVVDYLNDRDDVTYLDRTKAADREEQLTMMREAFTADSYFMSTNAITRDGVLVNIDGNGNRLSALIFGPKKVYIICGTNKICSDIDEAYARVKNIASPANCLRLNMTTPCSKTGKCGNCLSPDCVCSHVVFTRNSRDKDRIKVLIVDGEWGF